MPVSMDKIQSTAPNLVKQVNKAKISLSKRGLEDHTARVAIVLDYSYSMSGLYASGVVQDLAEKVLAIATQFDDDGDIDVFFFDNTSRNAGTLSINDYQGGVNRLTKGSMGGTDYGAAIREVCAFYGANLSGSTPSSAAAAKGRGFLRKAKTLVSAGNATSSGDSSLPVYVLFLTDGATSNPQSAEQALVEAAKHGIFWQFIGVGSDNLRVSFPTLDKYNKMPGRVVDNANAFAMRDMSSLSDMELYDAMLAEYPQWLQEAKAKGIL